MKLRILVFFGISFGLTYTAFAADYSALAAQGYRWVTIDGPYACLSQEDVKKITNHHTDETELQMVDDLQAYYLIPGAIAQVVQDDPASGMTQVRFGGITRDLWTYTKFLSKRPVEDPYGVIETPENSGLIPTATTGTTEIPVESAPTPTVNANPTPSVSPALPPHSRKSMRDTD